MITCSVKNNNCTEDAIEKLLKTSSGVSNQSFSFTRFLLLALLGYFQDGLQYRELNDTLGGISTGKLNADLNKLEKMSYIKKRKLKLENKNIRYYILTEEGKNEFLTMTDWVNSASKIVRGLNSTCQTTTTK